MLNCSRHRIKNALFVFLSCFVLLSSISFAVNPQEWLKKAGQRKTRRIGPKQTMVAAVRGVDEPSQVDPNARNFEALEKVEKRSYGMDKVSQFMSEGKLAPRAKSEVK